jgi:hypothetical protein
MATWGQRVGVAIHHTAGPVGQTPRQIQNHQMDNNGWADIGYGFLVNQAGTIFEGRAGGWLAIGAHAAGQNTPWIGVCWIGTSGSTAPSAAALRSLRWLVDEARRRAGRSLGVRGHGQVPGQATECPGSRLRAWIADGMPVTNPPPKEESMKPRDVWHDRVPWHAGATGFPASEPGWDLRPDGWRMSSLVQSGYGHSRRASERANRAIELGEAILAAVASPGDRQAILARIDAHHAEQLAAIAQAEARGVAEREELAELVRQGQSGELEAAAVVDELARRLAGES